jgi:hypothetical protein
MKNQNISSALSIKTKFSNSVHKILEPNLGVPRSKRWRNKNIHAYTDKEKLEIFEQILKLHDQISDEYSNCLYKNRQKKKVQKLRDESGYTAKQKEKRERAKLNKNSV